MEANRSTLPQGQLTDILIKILVSRRLHTLDRTGKADGVQIGFQDGLLGISPAEAQRTVDLSQFAQRTLDAAGAVIVRQVFDQLLLDGGCALL